MGLAFVRQAIISLLLRIQITRFYFIMAISVENDGGFEIIIKNSTTTQPFHRHNKATRATQKVSGFLEKGSNCRNVEQDLLLSLF